MRYSISAAIAGFCFLLAIFPAHAKLYLVPPPQLEDISLQQSELGAQATIKLSTPVRFVKYTMPSKYSKYLEIYYEHADDSVPVNAWSDMETILTEKTKLTPLILVNTRDQATHPRLSVTFDGELEASVKAGADGRSFVITFHIPPALFADGCRYPGSYVQAPGWICDEPVEGWMVTAVGTAEKEEFAGDVSKQTEEAAVRARQSMGENMDATTQRVAQDYLQQTKPDDTSTRDAVAMLEAGEQHIQIKQVAAADAFGAYSVSISHVPRRVREMVLQKSKVIKSAVGPNGTVYVLVGMNE
ncbi:MAG: hypothetical protein PHQ60_14015 [Sideroxydans sp.]|nr:hypothetical protein [Sideroxydans sp.]